MNQAPTAPAGVTPVFHNAQVQHGQGTVWGNQVTVPQGAPPPSSPFVTQSQGNPGNQNGNANQGNGQQNGNADGNQQNGSANGNQQGGNANQNGNTNQNGNHANQNGSANQDGNSNQNGNQGGTQFSEPTVVNPDGTTVSVKDYLATELSQINQTQARLDGYMEALKTLGTPASSEEGSAADPPPEDPKWQPITFAEDVRVEENERRIAENFNALLEDYNKQNAEYKQLFADQAKETKEIRDAVSQQIFESNMSRVVATTGIPREEILEMNQLTKIPDPDILATLIIGQRAKKEKETEIANQMEQHRQNSVNAIAGQTQGGSGQGEQGGAEQNTDQPGRGITLEAGQKLTPEMVASRYKFTRMNQAA